MRALGSLAFGLGSVVGACVLAAGVASYVDAKSEGRSFVGMSAVDLWTLDPVRVDRSKQDFERLPPQLSSYATAPAPVRTAAKDDHGADPAQEQAHNQDQGQSGTGELSQAHIEWCSARYKSYDPASNSYRSYSGETRTCASPVDQPVAQAEQPSAMGAEASAWCANRYRSYRAEDNTYRSYDGERRVCQPPGDLRDIVASRD